jgi:hypothetical protein
VASGFQLNQWKSSLFFNGFAQEIKGVVHVSDDENSAELEG